MRDVPTYVLAIEPVAGNEEELEALGKAHHAEMNERLSGLGLKTDSWNPDRDRVRWANETGRLLFYVARHGHEAVGYAAVTLEQEIWTGVREARVNGVYVKPKHRRGLGRSMVREVLADLKSRDVARVWAMPTTDPRVQRQWERMGFVSVANAMSIDLME